MADTPTPPAAPNYAAAAKETAAGNARAAIQNQYGNMVNQVTPQGTVTYTPQYLDKHGNVISNPKDIANPNMLRRWTQQVTLSPEQQALYDQNMQTNTKLGSIASQGVGYVGDALNNPLNFDENQQLYTPGEIQQQASDAAYRNASQYLDPQFQQSEDQLHSHLANQGITQGSEAYNNAMNNFARQKQQSYESARNQAYLQGMQGANQQYNQAMGTRQQQNAETQTLRQDPINMLNAVRSGQQMQVTTQPQVGVSNAANLQGWAGPDMLGAVTAQGQYNQGIYNAQAAQAGQTNSAIIGAAGSVAGAGMLSDRRLKKNIKRIGTHALGIGLYTWEYLWGQPFSGVMADEVEKIMPEAIITHPSGFKIVNYKMLGLA